MFTRPGKLNDRLPQPYPNEAGSIFDNGGAYPPDLCLLTKLSFFPNMNGVSKSISELEVAGVLAPDYLNSHQGVKFHMHFSEVIWNAPFTTTELLLLFLDYCKCIEQFALAFPQSYKFKPNFR
ncbi:hypothetical protein HAX54_013233 [Datura stramonium]|uniref:Uncharacterized protein n=1 Tax=Datura stramonium TaxID=4076 RepID=A0ABS8TKZ8_DATST|nr:hypothetical protein [Datura stramonium]